MIPIDRALVRFDAEAQTGTIIEWSGPGMLRWTQGEHSVPYKSASMMIWQGRVWFEGDEGAPEGETRGGIWRSGIHFQGKWRNLTKREEKKVAEGKPLWPKAKIAGSFFQSRD